MPESNYNDFIDKCKNMPLVLYGVCALHALFEFLDTHDISPVCFCDDDINKQGTQIKNMPVLSLDEIDKQYGKDTVFLITSRQVDSIRDKLLANDYPYVYCFPEFFQLELDNFFSSQLITSNKDSIDLLFSCLDTASSLVLRSILLARKSRDLSTLKNLKTVPTYFLTEIFNFCDKEVFVDAGACDGETTQRFINLVSNKFLRVYIFEPDKNNAAILKKSLARWYERICVYEAALYDVAGEINFDMTGTASSSICAKGNMKVKTMRLDDVISDDTVPPSFIKMDIEGSEMKALLGASNTIAMHAPKLAICVYHKPEDLWEIPIFLKSLVPEYKIHLRHHSDFLNETVCYATI
jgi:FkbM family methyltransferase